MQSSLWSLMFRVEIIESKKLGHGQQMKNLVFIL